MRKWVLALVLMTGCRCGYECGTVQSKVWSVVTGACYVITYEGQHLECDTARWPYVEQGDEFCGKVINY